MSPKEKPPYDENVLEGALSAKFSQTDVRFILREYRLQISPKSRMKQAIMIFNIINNSHIIRCSASQIASIFEVDRGNLSRAINKKPITTNGRPTLLSKYYEEELILYIYLRAEIHRPITKKDMMKYINEQFGITVAPSWYHNFLKRNQNSIAKTTAYPQEKSGIYLTKSSAIKHISNLKKYVNGVPTELVFNMDEVGQQSWSDRKSKKVIVPSSMKDVRIEYEVDRSEKKISLVSIISMAGDTLTPLIITNRKTVDKNLMNSGIRLGEDVIIQYQQSSFATKKIISDYINDVFLNYIENLRKNEIYSDKPAVLLCDNCSAHFDQEMINNLSSKNVRIITIPPHSSHLFQPLDLITFSVSKNEIRSVTSRYERKSQLDRIARVLIAFERSTISENNRNAFYRAGLEIDTSTNPNVARVNEEKLLQRITDYGLDNILASSRISPFGFINKQQII